MSKQFQNIEALKADQRAGLSIRKIAEKHGISYSTAFKYLGGGNKKSAPRRRSAAADNSAPTINATPELVTAVWQSLPLEKQAALLNKLSQI